MKQNRFKSAVLWTSIVAQVIVILQLTGALKAMGLDAGYIGNIVATVLQLLVTVGVLNDPTTADKF
jgi:phi LC3 family holin